MNFSSDKSPGKNFTGMTIIVLLHALVAYGIVTGLSKRTVTKIAEVVQVAIIAELVKPPPPQPIPAAPPIAAPRLKALPPAKVPPPAAVKVALALLPQIAAPVPIELQKIAVAAPSAPPALATLAAPVAPAAPPSPVKSIHTAAVADFNTCAKPAWPKSSLRNAETGTVTLSFLIDIDGRVADSKIVKSSGFGELDHAAVNGIGKCRFKPGSTDGKPEPTWMHMQYVWVLE